MVLSAVDSGTGEITPVRASIVDSTGRLHVPGTALELAADCGWKPVHNWFGPLARVQHRLHREATIHDPYRDEEQFYLDRSARLSLPPGSYQLRASKGPEYEPVSAEITVSPGERSRVSLAMSRWIDMPAEGWYSADDHLHIPRPGPGYDVGIASWMQAEDIHVGNFLQMGFSNGMYITPQYGFGSDAVFRDGATILASGQESPRTHVLGHSIVLGSDHWIQRPHDYLAYARVWEEVREAGGLSGYAHWGLAGAGEGIAAWGPRGLVDFLEVLGFGVPYYGVWYEMLNLGLRVTPTAGTDHPCSPDLPGRDRFYTRVEGGLGYESWLEGVRRGRTFVTNGPMLDLVVNGERIGSTVRLASPRPVVIRARARFDPDRDDVTALELVQQGEVIHSVRERNAPGVITLEHEREVSRSSWFAVRARGVKVGETPVDYAGFLTSYLSTLDWGWTDSLLESGRAESGRTGVTLPRDGEARPSAAHTAPVWMEVAGTPDLSAQPEARNAARAWVRRLDALERRFTGDRIQELAGFPGRGDGISLEDLERQRSLVLGAIRRARALYQRWLVRGEAASPLPGEGR